MNDLISRAAVIKAVDRHSFDTDNGLCLDDDITVILEEVPSAQTDVTDINVGDTISRQAALDALGERPLVWDEWTDEYCLGQRNQYDADKSAIEGVPSAQPYTEEEIQKMQDLEQAQLDKAYELGRQSAQPELIRCQDCEFFDGNDWCNHFGNIVKEDDYCSRAERRQDGSTR